MRLPLLPCRQNYIDGALCDIDQNKRVLGGLQALMVHTGNIVAGLSCDVDRRDCREMAVRFDPIWRRSPFATEASRVAGLLDD